jgi:cytochrome P450
MTFGERFERCAAHAADPYPFYAEARSAAPVFFSERYGLWFVSRYDDIVAILRDPETFSSAKGSLKPARLAPEVADILAAKRDTRHVGNVDPPEHTRLRHLLNQAFAPARLARYEPMIEHTADQLLDGLDPHAPDLVADYAYPLSLRVVLRVIGIPVEDLDRCYRWSQDKARLDFASDTMTVARQCEAARRSVAFLRYCDGLVAERARVPGDDLISRMLSAGDAEPLTETEVSDLLPVFVHAGYETAATLIGKLVLRLLEHPQQLAAVRSDEALIPRAVEECLRYDPPALGFVRKTTREVDLAGVRLPAGAKLFLLFGSANHDEHHWRCPEAFDVLREHGAKHLAFGQGVHFCVGARLARLEARIAVERLLRALPRLRLAEKPSFTTNLVLRKLDSLRVTRN